MGFVYTIVLALCIYSGFARIYRSSPSAPIVVPTISADVRVCDKVRMCPSNSAALKTECVQEVRHAYQEADRKCNGYKKAWTKCFNAHKGRKMCQREGQNYESCVATYVGDETIRWIDAPCVPLKSLGNVS